MPLSWNDIKSRALAFSQRWHDACNEDSEAKPFLIDFFEVFGITNKRSATFELAVKKFGGKQGFNTPIIKASQEESTDGNYNTLRPIFTDRQTQSGGNLSGAVGGDCTQYRNSTGWAGDQGVHERLHGQQNYPARAEVRGEIQPHILDDNCQHGIKYADFGQTHVSALTQILPPIRLYKSLDFVSAWHYTATAYMKHHPTTKTAFVSTNSITQGEQVAILWQPPIYANAPTTTYVPCPQT